jgi:hypothetical protein
VMVRVDASSATMMWPAMSFSRGTNLKQGVGRDRFTYAASLHRITAVGPAAGSPPKA